MSWLIELSKKRIYNYRTSSGKTLRGTQSELEEAFGVSIKCEPGDVIEVNGDKIEYAGFEPIQCPGMGRVGGNGSDRQIASMKKSFRKHFVDHELDDVRHKHGSAIDESLRAGEIRRRMSGSED